MNLYERVLSFIKSGVYSEQSILLRDCFDAKTPEALVAVQLMFEDMYGGETYNFYPKAQAAYCLLYWNERGLEALYGAATRSPFSKNISLALQIFATLSARQKLPNMSMWVKDQQLVDNVMHSIKDWDSLFRLSHNYLHRLVMSFDADEDAASAIGSGLGQASFLDTAAAKQMVIALSSRWLAVSTPCISAYNLLLESHATDEPEFQAFFERHPQLLDPMAHQVWPKPNLHGFKEPDFIIRRTDDTYLIVEIETPAKSLVTSSCQVSADVSHAVSQVMQYCQFLTEHVAEAEKHFPGFKEPECLVVLGVERVLTVQQKEFLVLENQHRSGLKIVGFDWIARRAEAISKNIIENSIEVQSIRLV